METNESESGLYVAPSSVGKKNPNIGGMRKKTVYDVFSGKECIVKGKLVVFIKGNTEG